MKNLKFEFQSKEDKLHIKINELAQSQKEIDELKDQKSKIQDYLNNKPWNKPNFIQTDAEEKIKTHIATIEEQVNNSIQENMNEIEGSLLKIFAKFKGKEGEKFFNSELVKAQEKGIKELKIKIMSLSKELNDCKFEQLSIAKHTHPASHNPHVARRYGDLSVVHEVPEESSNFYPSSDHLNLQNNQHQLIQTLSLFSNLLRRNEIGSLWSNSDQLHNQCLKCSSQLEPLKLNDDHEDLYFNPDPVTLMPSQAREQHQANLVSETNLAPFSQNDKKYISIIEEKVKIDNALVKEFVELAKLLAKNIEGLRQEMNIQGSRFILKELETKITLEYERKILEKEREFRNTEIENKQLLNDLQNARKIEKSLQNKYETLKQNQEQKIDALERKVRNQDQTIMMQKQEIDIWKDGK